MKAAKEEFLAVVKLLNRSSVNSMPNNLFARNLSTSLQLFEKQQPDGKESKKDSNESDKEQMQNSSSDDNKPNDEQNKQSNRNDDEKRKKDKKTIEEKDRMNTTEKVLAYITKIILWTCLIYSIVFTMLVVTSILRGDTTGRGDINNYIVSWKEFVQYMLAAGEVKEIIIRPQYDYVRIILHDGAVINGRRPRYFSYMLSVPDVERFEQRLRQVEKSMGISDGKNTIYQIKMKHFYKFYLYFSSISGVSIRYERFSELYFKLFAGAVACVILYSILKRMRSAVSVSGDKFVSFQANIR